MIEKIDAKAMAQLFADARTHTTWQDKPVDMALLEAIWTDAAMGPTSANCMPARIIFVQSVQGKARLKPCLAADNVEKTMSAPVTAIIAHDLEFYEKLPTLFPHTDARSWFTGDDALIESTAFRNATLQGAYLIMAARAHGLDCGPMSGFDPDKVDAEFFADKPVQSNFLCNLGYGTPDGLHPRGPRLSFAEACSVA